MRWSIIRTIWFREMRDQLRDRRTLLVIIGLPLILYPLLGFAVVRVAADFADRPSVVGVVAGPGRPQQFPLRGGRSPLGAVSGAAVRLERFDYPPLIDDARFFAKPDSKMARDTSMIELIYLDRLDPNWHTNAKIDLVLDASADFFAKLEQGEVADGAVPSIHVHVRPGEDRSRLALRRLTPILNAWNIELKNVRLARKGLTEKFLDPFELRLPAESGGLGRESVINLAVRFFPLMLVLWSLSGALYPAVDLCAGEKERGTMETLLITPAGREEIVIGKFLTIWVFSAGTALVNLASMGITTEVFAGYLPSGGISIDALLWCVVLSLPQAAFFSALGLAIGAYARSSKEGQYYLMPLFVVTLPLICLTLVPGIELNPLYSMVPVTGVALLMQRLMAEGLSLRVAAYFVPVLAPIGLYSWLSLRWAIEQFNREDVLFREAERLDWGLWLKRLFRDKEATPTTGQAFFCLGVLIGLRWLTQGLGDGLSLSLRTGISQLAFVAMPPLFMVMLLNTQPAEGLYLHWPRKRETGLAALLALLLLAPMTGLTQAVAVWLPDLLQGAHPLIAILRAITDGRELGFDQVVLYMLAFALVPALCEEVAFRGFVLRGMHHGFRPRNAVLLSSFFFALFHLNVFLFAPTFLLGVVLGLLTVRSRSLLPAIAFHFLHNAVLIALIPLSRYSEGMPRLLHDAWPWFTGVSTTAAAALVWWLYRKPYVDLARKEAAERASETGV